MENNNNIAKRNYFSSNLHDVTAEMLKAERRQEQTEKYQRKKRSYTKHNHDYWEKEINKTRKRQRKLYLVSQLFNVKFYSLMQLHPQHAT